MITKILIPTLSTNVDEGTITAWLKQEGDEVRKGEALVEITTEKASFEIESPRSGTVRKILAAEKSALPSGYVVALIGLPADPLPDVGAENAALLDHYRRQSVGRSRAARPRPEGRVAVRATPSARRLARELGVDLAELARKAGGQIVTEAMVRAGASGAVATERAPRK